MKDARWLKIGLPELRFDSVERTSFFWWVQVLEDRSTNAFCVFHAIYEAPPWSIVGHCLLSRGTRGSREIKRE